MKLIVLFLPSLFIYNVFSNMQCIVHFICDCWGLFNIGTLVSCHLEKNLQQLTYYLDGIRYNLRYEASLVAGLRKHFLVNWWLFPKPFYFSISVVKIQSFDFLLLADPAVSSHTHKHWRLFVASIYQKLLILTNICWSYLKI